MKENIVFANQLNNIDLRNKRVFLRADLNVPVKNRQILDDYKLQKILPTLNLLKAQRAKVILATHIGRPTSYDPNLSTAILTSWFEKRNYQINLEDNLEEAYKKSFESPNEIILLENLRFSPGEKNQDAQFAEQLVKLADYYVNDAFGTIHQHDTSVTILAQKFSIGKKFVGPLIKKELDSLNKLINNPEKSLTLIMGGKKTTEKIPFIQHILPKIQTLLLCPAIVFTFLKALGKNVGKSLVDEDLVPIIPKMLQLSKELNTKIVFPIDYQVAKDNFDGSTYYTKSDKIDNHDFGISIGPKTVESFRNEILKSKNIFFNGVFGNTNKQETLIGLKSVFDAMVKSDAYTVIGGGHSVALAQLFGIGNKIRHLSTGGGSSLAYLSGLELPGLKAIFNN